MPTGADHQGRPLAVLRAMIDSVDHEILQLMARRNGLVAEVAAFKRATGKAIRDFDRERELLEDRRSRAVPLGLSPEVIESIWRLTLWASRDRQAALKAEVPENIEPRTVAVIGGRGEMGACMAGMFADLGHAVMIADLGTQLTNEEAARHADVVVVSVPIDATDEVIRAIGPLVREDALLMDLTSIKAAPVRAMVESSRATVIGAHPLFGPSVHSLQGQRIVLTPGRVPEGDAWMPWLQAMLHARGLNALVTTPEAHDDAMAIVQVLTHFSTEVLGRTLDNLNVAVGETLEFTSPVYLMDMLLTARHFAQSSALYASIQMHNPRTGEVADAFVAAATELRDIASRGDREAFAAMFRSVRDRFGPFRDQALEQSSYLIDRLVERA
ncbi:MAG: bifunctional chorismate mutase/prephenate dehydrogenase [Phycisphaeraceae bacterium]|nr:bifunctional chorismate mutase/prephenate dehydrogenase [Phycisphaeraceae bacterium]